MISHDILWVNSEIFLRWGQYLDTFSASMTPIVLIILTCAWCMVSTVFLCWCSCFVHQWYAIAWFQVLLNGSLYFYLACCLWLFFAAFSQKNIAANNKKTNLNTYTQKQNRLLCVKFNTFLINRSIKSIANIVWIWQFMVSNANQ